MAATSRSLDLSRILDTLPVGVWVARVPTGEVAYANRESREILGMDAVEGATIHEAASTYGVFDLDGRPYPVEGLPFSRALAAGGPVAVDDMVIHRPDGVHVNIRAFAYPVWSEAAEPTHVVVAFIDITAEKRAEAARKQTESRLAFAVDHAPIVIWSADRHGVVTLSQGAGLASLGCQSSELVGQNLFELYAGHPSIPGFLRRALTGESFAYTVQAGEAVYETWVTSMKDPSGQVTGITALSHDVTALRKLQASAIQNDRVIALGTLAASVAHEINNPLSYMLGHLNLLSQSVDRLEQATRAPVAPSRAEVFDLVTDIRESLEPVRGGTERVAAITRELRTFSHPAAEAAVVDVQAAVASVLKLVGKELESRAEVILDLQKTSPVAGSSARLVQVVLNLVVNAMQALPSGPSHANRIWIRTADHGDVVVIEVADNGAGVRPEHRERIFEPFQTTKEIGEGSGLGLFVCRNIVNAWSGQVTVDERPGGGARFRVELPAAREAESTRSPESDSAPPPPPAPGHVMIVDDDPRVARILCVQLEAAGYRVTVEPEAGQALEHLADGRDRIDLVYCDLMMKGLSGMDLADALAARAPSRLDRVVFMTGGAFTPRAREFREAHARRCVEKPFDVVADASQRLDARASG